MEETNYKIIFSNEGWVGLWFDYYKMYRFFSVQFAAEALVKYLEKGKVCPEMYLRNPDVYNNYFFLKKIFNGEYKMFDSVEDLPVGTDWMEIDYFLYCFNGRKKVIQEESVFDPKGSVFDRVEEVPTKEPTKEPTESSNSIDRLMKKYVDMACSVAHSPCVNPDPASQACVLIDKENNILTVKRGRVVVGDLDIIYRVGAVEMALDACCEKPNGAVLTHEPDSVDTQKLIGAGVKHITYYKDNLTIPAGDRDVRDHYFRINQVSFAQFDPYGVLFKR